MPTSTHNILEPAPGSLIEEAFQAARGTGSHESLGAFVAHCMSNGDPAPSLPRCVLEASVLLGPELVDLSEVRRIVGVGPRTEITEDHDAFYGNVERIEENMRHGCQPAPFIAQRRDDDWYYLLDGNHTKMALKRLGIPQWWTIILETSVSCEAEGYKAA